MPGSTDFLSTVRERISLPGLTVAAMALACGFQLFVPPIVGLSDTGDMTRNAVPAGLRQTGAGDQNRGFVIGSYDLGPRRLVGDDGLYDRAAFSSEVLFLNLARLLPGYVSKTNTFDLRWAGLIHLAGLLTGVWLALRALSGMLGGRALWVSCFLTFFIFTDVGYVSYLNSLYGDAASLTSLALFSGCALTAARHPSARRWAWLFLGAAVLLLSAKAQNTLLMIPSLYYLGRLAAARLEPRERRGLRIGGALVVLFGVLTFLEGQPGVLRKSTIYQAVFSGILHESSTREADLAELGLPTDWARYARQDYWVGERSPRLDPEFDRVFFSSMSLSKVAFFYLRHPGHLLGIAQVAAARSQHLRMPYMGNFEKDEGRPAYAWSGAFDLWSRLKPALPQSLPGFGLCLIAWTAFAFKGRGRSPQGALVAEAFLSLVGVLVIQFFTCILAEGLAAIDRHLFLFNAAFDVLLIGSAAWALQRFERRAGLEPVAKVA